jgi:hypothetical protein
MVGSGTGGRDGDNRKTRDGEGEDMIGDWLSERSNIQCSPRIYTTYLPGPAFARPWVRMKMLSTPSPTCFPNTRPKSKDQTALISATPETPSPLGIVTNGNDRKADGGNKKPRLLLEQCAPDFEKAPSSDVVSVYVDVVGVTKGAFDA